jgi:ABC-type polysaccharide/polyol phosphate transport system ATPase subunit
MIAVRFDRVCKSFPHHAGQLLLRQRLAGIWRSGPAARFQALTDVSFTLQDGASLGVIGPNGAGKSTLLSVATRLTPPDRGTVEVKGRAAALLELGSGFHPDLTGAENICINAALLGMSRRQVNQRFDEIVEFYEIGDFIHEPIRTYSSGMVMRLAFSVAVNTEPDVLLLDEIVGVGDQAFFAKCVEKLVSFRRSGKTLMCASHSPEIVKQLCEQALWLDHGRVVRFGPVHSVMEEYLRTAHPALHASV